MTHFSRRRASSISFPAAMGFISTYGLPGTHPLWRDYTKRTAGHMKRDASMRIVTLSLMLAGHAAGQIPGGFGLLCAASYRTMRLCWRACCASGPDTRRHTEMRYLHEAERLLDALLRKILTPILDFRGHAPNAGIRSARSRHVPGRPAGAITAARSRF